MVLELIWTAGEILSIAVLIGGAWLTLTETEPFATLLASAKVSTGARFHKPLNHRLVDESRYMVDW